MPRSDWTDLPCDIRHGIEARIGSITDVRSAPTGNHADIAATVETTDGRMFVKAARKLDADRDGPEVWSLRRESIIAPHVTRFAPDSHSRWRPGSGSHSSLNMFPAAPPRTRPAHRTWKALAKVVYDLQTASCPDVVTLCVEQRWEPLTHDDVSPMAGDALLHTDLNHKNVIISGDGRADRTVRVVDWALVSRGAAWVEVGQLIPWLILDGHSPRQADAWAAQIPSWRDTDPKAVDLYSRLAVEFWQRRSRNRPEPWMAPYLAAWQQWATYHTE